MSNLLNKDTLHSVKRQQLFRLTITLLLSILIVSALGIASLLPIYILVKTERRGIEDRVSVINELLKTRTVNKKRDEIIHDRRIMEFLGNIINKDKKPTDGILVLLGRKPNGANVSEITYTKFQKYGTFRVVGHVKNISDINEYINSLKSDVLFGSVTIPLSAFVGKKDNKFIIDAKGTF